MLRIWGCSAAGGLGGWLKSTFSLGSGVDLLLLLELDEESSLLSSSLSPNNEVELWFFMVMLHTGEQLAYSVRATVSSV